MEVHDAKQCIPPVMEVWRNNDRQLSERVIGCMVGKKFDGIVPVLYTSVIPDSHFSKQNVYILNRIINAQSKAFAPWMEVRGMKGAFALDGGSEANENVQSFERVGRL